MLLCALFLWPVAATHTWGVFAAGKQRSLDPQVVSLPLCYILVMCIEVGIDEEQAGVLHVGQRNAHCSLVVPDVANACSHTHNSQM